MRRTKSDRLELGISLIPRPNRKRKNLNARIDKVVSWSWAIYGATMAVLISYLFIK